MKWVESLSCRKSTPLAVEECLEQLDSLEGRPDLLLLMASGHHRHHAEGLQRDLQAQLDAPLQLGCMGVSVLSGGRELGEGPALAMLAATLPETSLRCIHFTRAQLAQPESLQHALEDLQLCSLEQPGFLLLGNCEPEELSSPIRTLDSAFSESPKIGAVLPGDSLIGPGPPGERGLTLLSWVGELALHPVSANGARRVGPPMTVTASGPGTVLELDGKDATATLLMLLEQEVPHLLVQARHQLLLTVYTELVSAQPPALPQIYPILPGSSLSKGLKIETQLPLGSRVQLSLQEPRASSRRLKELLDRQDAPSGILQFNSLDRGASFYGRPHHDASLVYASLGARPHLGVGCRMELLSLGGRTRLVRGSSTLGLLQPRRWN